MNKEYVHTVVDVWHVGTDLVSPKGYIKLSTTGIGEWQHPLYGLIPTGQQVGGVVEVELMKLCHVRGAMDSG